MRQQVPRVADLHAQGLGSWEAAVLALHDELVENSDENAAFDLGPEDVSGVLTALFDACAAVQLPRFLESSAPSDHRNQNADAGDLVWFPHASNPA